MTQSIDLLWALMSQTAPEMGRFEIEQDTNIEEFLWNMFRVRIQEAHMNPGLWIYRYDMEDKFPYEAYDMKIHNEEGDTIYLYQIK